VVFGAAFATALFWLLSDLVRTPFDPSPRVEARSFHYTRLRPETAPEPRRREKIERELPPPVPEVPRIGVTATGVKGTVARLAPIVDRSGGGLRTQFAAGSDRDVIPLVRVPPEYPPRAITLGIEGWVLVEFTITATGSVTDALIAAAEPAGVFDDAALKAIARWRYNPKIENGAAVERVSVQTKIVFELPK
jgi:protein TonB